MVRLLITAMVVLAPALAHAQIYSSVEATANTGGNTAGPGESVTTGDASASVQVTTQGNNQGSTVHVKTETNGQVYEKTVEANKKIDVSVKATPQKTEVRVQKDNEPAVTVVTTASTSASSTVVVAADSNEAPVLTIFSRISTWLSNLFSFLF